MPLPLSPPNPLHPLHGAKGLGATSAGAGAQDICLHEWDMAGAGRGPGEDQGGQMGDGGRACVCV